MKKTFLLALLCCLVSLGFAGNVISVNDAKTVSKNFIKAAYPTMDVTASDFVLKHTELDENGEPVYYQFAINEHGFIVVSANDAVTPILAYSLTNNFNAKVQNYALSTYRQLIIDSKDVVNAQTAAAWNKLMTYEPRREQYITEEVKPFATSLWNQGKYFNYLCPAQEDASQYQHNLDCDNHVPAGCVATAMTQIMYYYRFPEYGVGGISYVPIHIERDDENNPIDTFIYPRQTQSFAGLHDYNAMTDELTHYNGEVAKLMWHAGLSVMMDYGPTGSGAQSADALTVFKNNWKYNRTAQMYSRSDYSNTKWADTLKRQLNLRRPIYYSGADAEGGHAFVLDGYQVVYDDSVYTNTMMHINWGWGGDNNGYYALIGAGHMGGYTQNEAAMIDLYPADQVAKETTGHVRVHTATGSISDGAGNLNYEPNTDRTWTIYADDATRYSFHFSRLETEANNDVVIFYKNGDMANEVGRYSGNTLPNAFSINADSVTVRFQTNSNDVTDKGFVLNFTTVIPESYCSEDAVALTGSGTITDKGDANVAQDEKYRANGICKWKIDGANVTYFSYPKIDLGLGDYVDIYEYSTPNKYELLKRIDIYNWPEEDVFTTYSRRIRIHFVTDNYDEKTGFELTYQAITDIKENGISDLSIYPNPASSLLNINLTAENEGQLSFQIVDMTGRVIATENVENYGGELHHTMNVSNLSKGMYMLRIAGQEGTTVHKFIVE